MNLRNSVGLVGLFLAAFWVFGLLLALRGRQDETLVMPAFAAARDTFAIDAVTVERRVKGAAAEEYRFTHHDETWNLRQGTQSIKVEGFRIKDILREAQSAQHDLDAGVSNLPAQYGLEPPQATITFIGTRKKNTATDEEEKDKKPETTGPEREWKLYLGNESSDKKYIYTASSDRPNRVFAVAKNSVSSLFFKNINDLRSKRLFDFNEPIVQSFVLRRGESEFEAKKADAGAWKILKPDLGYADFEGPPPSKDARSQEGGLKGLINAVAGIRVDAEDDFIAADPGNLKRYDLEPGKETYRITVLSGEDKKPTDETLLVGKKEGDYYYARLATDEGVFKLRTKYLDPIEAAIARPAKFRNVDLSPIAIKDAEAITLAKGKTEATFYRLGEGKAWQIDLDGKRTGARTKAIESLLDVLQGHRDILGFREAADAKKLDAELGLDAPTMMARVYLKGVDDPKKGSPDLKKGAKPDVVWELGKSENDTVAVKRTTTDGRVERFTVAKTLPEKIVPREGFLAYLEMSFPRSAGGDIVRAEVERGGKSLVLTKSNENWQVRSGAEATPADEKKVRALLEPFAALPVERWVKKLDPKEDLDAYGLKTPTLTIALVERKDVLSPQSIGSVLVQLGGILGTRGLSALGVAYASHQAGEKGTITIGKIAKEEAGTYYARHSGTDRLALVSEKFVKLAQTIDLRDPSVILNQEVYLASAAFGSPGLLAGSPLVTGVLGTGNADAIQELKITLRTPIELRNFAFQRQDKGWIDRSGLREFQLDEVKVNAVLSLVMSVKIDRWVALSGGTRAEQKLAASESLVILEAVGKDGKTTTLTIGADFEGHGYFSTISTWPGAVFLLSPEQVRPLLGGAASFAKERVALAN